MNKKYSFILAVMTICVILSSSGVFAQAWWGSVNRQIPPQTGTFTIEFDLVPRDTSVYRAHIVMSQVVPGTVLENGWHSNSIIIHCKWQDHMMDARNAGTYEAIEEIEYFTGESYHFKWVVDVGAQTYDAMVKSLPDGAEMVIAEGYGFRTDAVDAGLGDEMNYIGVTPPFNDVDNGKIDSGAEIKNIKIMDADGNVVFEDPGTEYVPPPDFNLVMDAQRDEWYNSLTGPENGHVYIPYEAVGTGTMPDDEIDLSAWVWFGWDEEYLYCYTEVMDEYVVVNNSTAYENDAVELKFDPDPYAEAETGVYGQRLSALGEDVAEVPEGVDNLGTGESDSGSDWEAVEGEDYARIETDTGYNLEFRVPFETFVKGDRIIDNSVGGIFGLAINIMDNDDAGRESVLRWSSNMNDAVWNEPPRHGTATFLENHMISLSTENTITGVDTNSIDYTPPDVAVEKNPANTPKAFQLAQNYPNPFNPTTTIAYNLEKSENVTLKVFDITGKQVGVIVNQVQNAGEYTVTFDGSKLSSGVYFFHLQAGAQRLTKKMRLLK